MVQRLEQAAFNLDSAEISTRSLLTQLEDDRKALSRLSAEYAKTSAAETKFRALAREREDARQELEDERKRANAADARARKALDRLGANFERRF